MPRANKVEHITPNDIKSLESRFSTLKEHL